MWQIGSACQWQPFRKIAMVGVTTIGVSALGVAVLLPSNRPVTMGVLETAAIVESNTTLGFADSDLYGMTPQQIDAALDQMQAMGVDNVRIMIPWAGVEYYPGFYNWTTVDYMVEAADSRGMGILAVLNSTPFWATEPGQPALSGAPADPAQYGEFAGLVAERYAGKVGAYEIWNEPNAYIFYAPEPDPAGYTELLKAAYPAIKAADPDAIVVGGVLGAVTTYENLTMNPITFVEGIYQAGGGDYFDALSYHPYQYTLPFSLGGWHPDSPINQLAAMHDVMVANGDTEKLIWASEYGEPSNVAGEANQAAFLLDMVTTWRTLDYTGPTFVWTLQDRNTGGADPEDNFGVIRTDGSWKPAAYTIQQLASLPSTAELAAAVSRTSSAALETASDLTTSTAPQAIPIATDSDPAAIPATSLAVAATPATATATDIATAPVDASPATATSPTAVAPDAQPTTAAATTVDTTQSRATDTQSAQQSTGSTSSKDRTGDSPRKSRQGAKR